jgi:hypothetical protein
MRPIIGTENRVIFTEYRKADEAKSLIFVTDADSKPKKPTMGVVSHVTPMDKDGNTPLVSVGNVVLISPSAPMDSFEFDGETYFHTKEVFIPVIIS